MNLDNLLSKAHNVRKMKPHRRLQAVRDKSRAVTINRTQRVLRGFVGPSLGLIFHLTYYHTHSTWLNHKWFGVPIQQFPSDLHIYQEIIAATVPDYIVQTGVFDGGSALFLANMLDLAGAPETALVIAIDIELRPRALELKHPRIRLIEGSSVAPEVLAKVEFYLSEIPSLNGGMVSLDSDHSERHVSRELELYPRFVGLDNYLIVEDTTVNGRPVLPLHGPGPGESLDKWLPLHPEFKNDDAIWKRHLFSAHAGGWLKRVS